MKKSGGPIVERMSERERQVFDLVLDGKPVPAIARRLKVTASTVRTYQTRVLRAFKVSNREELLIAYYRDGKR